MCWRFLRLDMFMCGRHPPPRCQIPRRSTCADNPHDDRGNGQQAQLGRRIIERRKTNGLAPERLALRKIARVGSGSYHSFAIDHKGVVYAWVRLSLSALHYWLASNPSNIL